MVLTPLTRRYHAARSRQRGQSSVAGSSRPLPTLSGKAAFDNAAIRSCGHNGQMTAEDQGPPLSDRVTGKRSSTRERLERSAGLQSELATAAFAPLDSKRRLFDGIEGGAAAVYPLALVHGWQVFWNFFQRDFSASLLHAALTGLAVACYYAVLHGRTIWPSILVLFWLVVEVALGRSVFGYLLGGSVLNWMVIPVAILGVRASWRRRASSHSAPQPAQ